jgi:hypothetical protein
MGSRRTVAGHRQAPGTSVGTSVRRFPQGVVLFWTAALVFASVWVPYPLEMSPKHPQTPLRGLAS